MPGPYVVVEVHQASDVQRVFGPFPGFAEALDYTNMMRTNRDMLVDYVPILLTDPDA